MLAVGCGSPVPQQGSRALPTHGASDDAVGFLAALVGVLELRPGDGRPCLVLEGSEDAGGGQALRWPVGYAVSADGQHVLDAAGGTVAPIGERVALGGGYLDAQADECGYESDESRKIYRITGVGDAESFPDISQS